MDLDVVIISNSPGELSSWVRVTVEKVRKKSPLARIVLMLVPCPYASGREADIARSYPEIDLVLSPRDFLGHLMASRSAYRPARDGVVVFLGGDYWHSLFMSRKLGFPAVAYTDRTSSWGKYFRNVCVPDESTRRALLAASVPSQKIAVVGNLMVEGVRPTMSRDQALTSWGLQPQRLTVGLFPGSRSYHVQSSLSVFLRVAEDLKQGAPDVQFALGLSPFVTQEDLTRSLRVQPPPSLAGSEGRLVGQEGALAVETDRGLRIPVVRSHQYDLMQASDMLLTIPGTNTAEMAYLGRPMVVAMSWRTRVPRGGLGSALLNTLPMASRARRGLIKGILRKLRYTALPNQIAGREVVPEVRVEDEPAEISRVALDLLLNAERRAEMGAELRALMGCGGASDRVAEIILAAAESSVTPQYAAAVGG